VHFRRTSKHVVCLLAPLQGLSSVDAARYGIADSSSGKNCRKKEKQ
jgi:hypothetical protein